MGKKTSAKWPGVPEQEIEGFIAEGTRLSGDLVLEGGFRIDGRVEGRVETRSTLIVGPPGEVDTEELRATTLLVSGVVRGTLHIDDRLEIQPGGKVYGDVTMKKPGLVLSQGGLFEGNLNMQPDPDPETAKADPDSTTDASNEDPATTDQDPEPEDPPTDNPTSHRATSPPTKR